MTLQIRPYLAGSAAETSQVDALLAQAFADEGKVARLVAALRNSADALAGLELVAVEADSPDAASPAESAESAESVEPVESRGPGERVVGHVMVSRGLLDARRELVDVHVLAPLAVLPQRHGQGIGAALVQAAVQASRAAGAPAVFLEGDPGYYARHGFVGAEPLGFRRPSLRTPAPAFQVSLGAGHEEWMTGTLIYSRVFWDHDSVGLRDPDLAQIEAALGG